MYIYIYIYITTYWDPEHLCALFFEILSLCNGRRHFHDKDLISISLTSQYEKEQGLLDPGIFL